MEKLPKNQAAATPAPPSPIRPFPLPAGRPAARKTPKKEDKAPLPATTSPVQRLGNKAIAGLGRRAGGYVTTEVKTTYETDPDGTRRIKNQVVTRRQNPPDLEAVVFALTNIDGARWRTKPDGTAAPEGAALDATPDEVLRKVLPYFDEDAQ